MDKKIFQMYSLLVAAVFVFGFASAALAQSNDDPRYERCMAARGDAGYCAANYDSGEFGSQTAQTTTQQSGGSLSCGSGFEPVGGTCVPKQTQTGGFFANKTFGQLVAYVIKALLMLAGVLAVFFIILGGYRYITAQGNEDQAEEGKNSLKHAVIGLVLVMLSYVIVTVITNTLAKGL